VCLGGSEREEAPRKRGGDLHGGKLFV